MKIKLLLFCLLLPLIANGQHAEILGVPIDGTISQFTTKFNNKGIKTDWTTTKQISSGEARWFKGTYYGRKCDFIAYFIPTSKIVYRVKVVIDQGWTSTSSCENLVTEIKNALAVKYDMRFEGDTYDGHKSWHGPITQVIHYQGESGATEEGRIVLGWIDIYMSLNDGYKIHIDFYDRENYNKYRDYLDSTI